MVRTCQSFHLHFTADICRIRLDFDEFVLTDPDTTTGAATATAGEGQCTTDKLVVLIILGRNTKIIFYPLPSSPPLLRQSVLSALGGLPRLSRGATAATPTFVVPTLGCMVGCLLLPISKFQPPTHASCSYILLQ